MFQTHKTGGQTLASLFNRYALTHNLTVAIRKNLRGHVARSVGNWTRHVRPLPAGLTHYDMLTDHVWFNERCVRHFLPADTKFVSIVREPFDRFVSAFFFYKDVWRFKSLKRIPGKQQPERDRQTQTDRQRQTDREERHRERGG